MPRPAQPAALVAVAATVVVALGGSSAASASSACGTVRNDQRGDGTYAALVRAQGIGCTAARAVVRAWLPHLDSLRVTHFRGWRFAPSPMRVVATNGHARITFSLVADDTSRR